MTTLGNAPTTPVDKPTDPFDTVLQRFASQGVRHQQLAGPLAKEYGDPDFDTRRQHLNDARNGLAAVLILRHVRRVAPELAGELADLAETAWFLEEFGMLLKLDRYLVDAGGSPDFIRRDLEFLQRREIQAASESAS